MSIEKGYQRNSPEKPHWLIPKEKVDNLLSAPNVANEEDLVKLKSENRKCQVFLGNSFDCR